MKKIIIWWISTAALGLFLGWLFNSCSNPTDLIKEHPNQKEIDSLEIERDKAQKRLDSLIKVRDSRI